MTQYSDAARRFLDATLASRDTSAEGSQSQRPSSVQMLVGSCGRDVIILGDVPPGAVEMFLGRGRRQQPPTNT